MNELDLLCHYLKEGKVKSMQKCFDLCFYDVKKSVDIFGWNAVLLYINEKSGMSFKKYRIKDLYYRSKKKLDVRLVTGKQKKESSISKKNPKNINNIENHNQNNNFQSKYKNLNKPSIALINRYSLTDNDLDKLGIAGITETMTVFDIIKKHCDKIDSDKKLAEFSHLIK